MAQIYVAGVSDPIDVTDAPDFEEAAAMISDMPDVALVIFSTLDEDIAVTKSRLIMFAQKRVTEKKRQYVVPSTNSAELPRTSIMPKPKKARKKRAGSKSV